MKSYRRIATLYILWLYGSRIVIPPKDIVNLERRIINSRPHRHSKSTYDYRIKMAFADRHKLIKAYYDMLKLRFKTL